MEIDFLKTKLDDKNEISILKDTMINDLKKDKNYLQIQNHIMRVHFMPADIGFWAGLLPSGKKAKKVRSELDELERKYIKDDEIKVEKAVEVKKIEVKGT